MPKSITAADVAISTDGMTRADWLEILYLLLHIHYLLFHVLYFTMSPPLTLFLEAKLVISARAAYLPSCFIAPPVFKMNSSFANGPSLTSQIDHGIMG